MRDSVVVIHVSTVATVVQAAAVLRVREASPRQAGKAPCTTRFRTEPGRRMNDLLKGSGDVSTTGVIDVVSSGPQRGGASWFNYRLPPHALVIESVDPQAQKPAAWRS